MGQILDTAVNGNEQGVLSSPNYERGRRPYTETPIRPFHPWELFEESIGSVLFNRESGRGLTPAEVDTAMKKLRKEIYWLPRKSKERGSREEKDCHHNSCSICLDEFAPRQQLLRLPCNHRFHSDCLIPWIKSNALCPFCRFDILKRAPPANSDDHAAAETA